MSYSTLKRSLEIEMISADGLMINRKPIKKKTFCVVKIDEKSRISKLDEDGGSNPIWKDKIEMDINGSVRFISVEVLYRTSGGQEKSIGYAEIPVTDFVGGFAPQGHVNFLSYRLRDEYGDKSGIVNLSILVKPDGNVKYSAPSHSPAVAPSGYVAYSSQAKATANGHMWKPRTFSSMAATAANGQMWRPKTSSSMAATAGYGGHRIVTGIPVSCAYQRPT